MKYIRTNASVIWGKNSLTKEYLGAVKETGDILIDIENEKWFDSENNQWKDIPSDDNPSPSTN